MLRGLRAEEAPLRWRRELAQTKRLRAMAMRLGASLGRLERKRDGSGDWDQHRFLYRLAHFESREMARCSFFGYADGCEHYGIPMAGGTADGKLSSTASSPGTPPTSTPSVASPPSATPASAATASRKASAKRTARRGRARSSAAAPAADLTSTCDMAGGTTNGDITTTYPPSGTPLAAHSEAGMAASLQCGECVAAVPSDAWTMAGRCNGCRYTAPQREVRAVLRWECLLDALPLAVDYDRVFRPLRPGLPVGLGLHYAHEVVWQWRLEQEDKRGRTRTLRDEADSLRFIREEWEDPVVWDGFESSSGCRIRARPPRAGGRWCRRRPSLSGGRWSGRHATTTCCTRSGCARNRTSAPACSTA